MLQMNTFDLPIYIKQFLKHIERLNYSQETLKGYAVDLNKFKDYLHQEYKGNILTNQIQKEDILDHLTLLKKSGLKQNSIIRNLSTIKSFFKYLVYEANFQVDVAAKIRHPKNFTPLPDILSPKEVEDLLATAKEYSYFYYVFFSLLYYTGSRLTPVRTLTREHVDLPNKRIYFEKVKNGKDLHLPLNSKMYNILNKFMLETRATETAFVFHSPKFIEKPISAPDVRINLKKIAKRAGITKRVSPHTIRHCTATHLTLMGVEQMYIASILGHADLRSTARYQQLNVENLRPAINQLGSYNEETDSKIFIDPRNL